MKKYKYQKSFTFDGKRYKVRADTEQELYEKMALKKRDLEEGRVVISGNMPVKEWVKKSVNTYKADASEKYKEDIKWRLNKALTPILERPIKSIKPIELQSILSSQADMSASYLDKLTNEIKLVFRTAYKNHLISYDPSDDLIKPKGTKGTRRSITEHERKHLLLVCDKDPRFIFFLLMLYTGCRPSEAAEVRQTDVIKKGDMWLLHIRGTKTHNSDRYVPIVPELLPKLLEKEPFALLAPNLAGKKHDKSSYRRMVSNLKRQLNISMGCKVEQNALVPPFPLSSDFVPYFLRHTFCTDLQKKGVDIRAAQKLMGHADIQTTANIYTHQDDDTLMQAAKQMGAVPKQKDA